MPPWKRSFCHDLHHTEAPTQGVSPHFNSPCLLLCPEGATGTPSSEGMGASDKRQELPLPRLLIPLDPHEPSPLVRRAFHLLCPHLYSTISVCTQAPSSPQSERASSILPGAVQIPDQPSKLSSSPPSSRQSTTISLLYCATVLRMEVSEQEGNLEITGQP